VRMAQKLRNPLAGVYGRAKNPPLDSWIELPLCSSIFQFRYEPEGTGIQVTSTSGLIGLKGEV